MEQDLQVSPDAETLNPAPEDVTPEIVTPDVPETTPEDLAAKSLKRLERRIDRLTASKYQTAAEAQQAREEASQLRARLAQYEQAEPAETLTPEKVLPIARQLAEHMRAQERVVDKVQAVMAAGKKLENFDAACNAVDEELPFYDGQRRPTAFLNTVMECDDPAAVLQHLGTHTEIAAELARLTPTQVARRLDRIETDLKKPVEHKTSNAPKPVTPVRGSAAQTGLSKSLSDSEWQRRFIEQYNERNR